MLVADPTPSNARLALSAQPSVAEIEQVTQALAQALQESAVQRDRIGGHAAAQRELIRASGLLNLTTPRAYGGLEQPWEVFYRSLRQLAQVDSALAHVYAFHHLQVATVLLYGTAQQHEFFLRPTVQQQLFWGNALNPNDKRTTATEDGQGWRIHGPKSYCSGSVGADQLTFSAWHAPTQSLLVGALPSSRAGVSIHSDWDAFGQKQTDSGSVTFDQVRLEPHEVLVLPGSTPTPRATLRTPLAQLILTNLYVGIARGALEQALRYTRDATRPPVGSGVARAVDDPYIQQRYGQLTVLVRPAEVLADVAAQAIDQALDRFWRNARVHTLHDPIDYKLRDLGRHALTGEFPVPSSYA